MKSIKKGAFLFLIIEAVLILFSFFMGGFWLINTQSGFISSMIIIFCSFYGYKKVVEKRVEGVDEIKEDERDLVDKKLDPYGLWEEEDGVKKTKLQSIKTSFKNTKNFSLGFLSPYRLFGYAVLVAICFFLIKENVFNPVAFLVGVSSTIISLFVYQFLGLKS